VIELWAKWCPPCRQIFPHLTSIYKAKKARGLSVVGVSIEDDPSLAAFVAGEGDRMGYTVAVDKRGVTQGLMQHAGASGIPHAFVVDRNSVIVFRCSLPTTPENIPA
jgi:thiol-disulfide isomerase/thioredoxin